MGVLSGVSVGAGGGLIAGLTVLLVEDHPLVALATADMLDEIGCHVVDVAGTVEEAMAAVIRGGFAVAVLDIDLEGRSSEGVAVALTAAGIPFLLTSGMSAPTAAAFAGARRLDKPYPVQKLRNALIAMQVPAAA